MTGISKVNVEHFPLPSVVGTSTPITNDEVGKSYLKEVKNFFVEKLGFYTVITHEEPNVEYNSAGTSKYYCFYFSDQPQQTEENPKPIFCIHTLMTPDNDISTRYSRFVLEACSSDGRNWFPISPVASGQVKPEREGDPSKGKPNNKGAVLSLQSFPNSINFFIRVNDGNDYCLDMRSIDIIVQDVKFEDGRRIIFFKSFNRVTKEWIGSHYWCALFYTDIYFRNIQMRDWIVLSTTFSSSYNREYGQHIANKSSVDGTSNFINLQKIVDSNPNFSSNPDNLYPYSSSSVTGGLIPGISGDKDYLIKQNFYIGDEAYIPQVYKYSNIRSMEISEDKKDFVLTNLGKMGDFVTIKNNNFLIIYNRFLLLKDFKEKYDVTKLNEGCFESKITGMGTYAYPFKTVNTESLLILI